MVRLLQSQSAAALLLAVSVALAQQRADDDFKPTVDNPAFTENHLRVVIDEAHHNFHTASGRYKPFADLLTADGCRVSAGKKPFSAASLKGCDLLVIANALGAQRMNTREAGQSAFKSKECDAVEKWVREGGALLLITDHFPTGLAAQRLGKRFGIDMSCGATEEYVFTAQSGLGDHPILRGRSEAERVRRVGTFSGQSLKGPAGSHAFLLLPDNAREHIPDKDDPWGKRPTRLPAGGRAQAIALRHGKGRVVVLGEAAMFSAQVSPQGEKFGMNVEGLDNRQLALNAVHWLAGLLEPPGSSETEKP